QDPIMEDEAANSNSDLVDAETEVAAPSSEEAAAPDEAANEGQTGQVPPPMPVVEAPSPIASDVEDDAEDHLEESQPPPQNGADAAQQADEDAEVNREFVMRSLIKPSRRMTTATKMEIKRMMKTKNGAALLQAIDQRDSQSHSRDEADRQLDNHRRELDQLQSNLRRELAEEKRQLDQRLARRQQGLPAGDSAAGEDRMLSSRQGARFHFRRVGQHRVLPSTLTSEELRLLDDVRQRLSRASIEEQQAAAAAAAAPAAAATSSGSRRTAIGWLILLHLRRSLRTLTAMRRALTPLVRSTHERLAGVSDRIRRYQQETSDYFNQSVLLGCSPTERGEAAAANGGHYAVDQHSFDDLAEHGDFKSRVGRGANRRYNGHSSASPVSAAVASAASPPSVRGGSEPPPLSLLHQLSPAEAVDNFDAEVAAVSRRRRNHPSASSRLGAVSVRMAPTPPLRFDEERAISCASCARRGRSVARCGAAPPAGGCARGPAEGVASVRREHATALARERAESERLRARLTEARAETDKLRRRAGRGRVGENVSANRERGVGLTPYPVTGAKSRLLSSPALRRSGLRSGQRRPPQVQRRRFASLWPIWNGPAAGERQYGRWRGGAGGAPAWDRDAQLAEIRTLEQRYDQLQLEKRRVETALNHVPSVGSAKYGRQSREDKERLEKRLDSIDRELGSLRITLRQYHFQISSGFTHPAASSAMEPPGQAATIYGCCRKRHGSLDGESAAPATKLFLTEEAVAANLGQLSLEAAARLTDESAAAAPAEQLATDEQQQQQLRLTVSSPEVARLIDLQASSAATASAAPTTAAASLLPTSSAAALPPAIAERVGSCQPPAVRAAAAPARSAWRQRLSPAAVRRDKRQQQRGKQEQQAGFALQPELQLQTMEAEEARAADAAAVTSDIDLLDADANSGFDTDADMMDL
uniref:Centrosomal protein of 162 kDa n=1 Tax=Macrostomum lignano TaxID=282301 RepID=A0A1I8GT70_9PLAT